VILLELGARHVETAATVSEAIDRGTPSFARLDLTLGSENSIAVGRGLSQMQVPFIFATGYGERAPIPADLGHVPVIQKPYTPDAIVATLGKLKLSASADTATQCGGMVGTAPPPHADVSMMAAAVQQPSSRSPDRCLRDGVFGEISAIPTSI
jgi:DNA-binding LytR/AlgR family response regulator